MIAKLNFVRNIIDLGAIAVNKVTAWMHPSQSSFNYPGSHLVRFSGLVLHEEMFKPNPKTHLDHNNLMVMKNGSVSNLTIGRLNTVRACIRTYSIDGQPGKMSKEVCVLPRNSKFGSFSARGDLGSNTTALFLHPHGDSSPFSTLISFSSNLFIFYFFTTFSVTSHLYLICDDIWYSLASHVCPFEAPDPAV